MDVLHFWGFKDPQLETIANRRMVDDIRAYPVRFARRVSLNAVEFYVPTIRDVLMPKTTRTVSTAVRRVALSIWHLGLFGLVFVGLWRNRGQKTALAGWLALAVVAILAGCYTPFVASICHNQYVLQTLPVLAFAAAANFAPGSSGTPREAA